MKEEKKILVTKASMPSYKEYCNLIKPLWESHWLTNDGNFHQELEKKLKKYLNIDNITLFTNGHLSLENAIKVLGITGEVITTPFTFISTTHAIKRCGLTPVFCDINKDDYTINVDKIEELITDKTSAIIPVHVYGNICNVEKIDKIAKKYNLKVIYDAAHAFGVKHKNKSIAEYGDISMFSFHATKVFNTIEGGALVYKDEELSTKLNRLKNFGIVDQENIDCLGGNAKMNEFQAAMGICNLKYIDDNIVKRKLIVEKYNELLSKIHGIKLNKAQKDVESNYAYYPIVIEDEYGISRDEVFKILESHNIYARKYFYPISNECEIYSDCVGNTPIAKDISKRVLTLPIYPDLELEDVKRICKILKRKE